MAGTSFYFYFFYSFRWCKSSYIRTPCWIFPLAPQVATWLVNDLKKKKKKALDVTTLFWEVLRSAALWWKKKRWWGAFLCGQDCVRHQKSCDRICVMWPDMCHVTGQGDVVCSLWGSWGTEFILLTGAGCAVIGRGSWETDMWWDMWW